MLETSSSKRATIESLENRTLLSAALDPGFAKSGILADYGPAVTVQNDGKIVAHHGSALVRLNPDGTTDKSFNPATFKAPSNALTQSTGKKIVVTLDKNHQITAISRYNTNGTLDTTFGVNGHFTAFLTHPTRTDSGEFGGSGPAASQYVFRPLYVALQGDNIIVAGEANPSGSDSANYAGVGVERVTANGKIDAAFGLDLAEPAPIVQGPPITTGVFVGNDQRIYIKAIEDTDADILGFDATGHLFDDLRVQNFGSIQSAVVGADGKINVLSQFQAGGNFQAPQQTVYSRYNPDLTPDTTLNGTGSYNIHVGAAGQDVTPTGLLVGADSAAIVSIDAGADQSATPYLLRFLPYRNPNGGDISGFFYNDANSNGHKDAAEAPLRYWQVYADKNNNGIFDKGEPTAYTDYNGYYKLKGLTAGNYIIREVRQDGWRRTSPAGDWPGGYYPVRVAAGRLYTGNDFGNTTLALVSGTVFLDKNANGKQDTGEGGLGGWTVYDDANNNGKLDSGERSAATNSSGVSSLALPAGTQSVRIVQKTGYRQTSPAGGFYRLTLSSGAMVSGKSFGE
jgi:uncharacterized delta-60 repeat protein